MIKDDAHGGRGRGVVSDGQPCDFGSVLVVGVGESELGFEAVDDSTGGIPIGNIHTTQNTVYCTYSNRKKKL